VKLVEHPENYQNIGYVAMRVFVLVKLWLIQYRVCGVLSLCFTIVARTAILMNQRSKILLMPLIVPARVQGSMHVPDGALWVYWGWYFLVYGVTYH